MSARHAATDGSFGRSAGGAALRGAGLLAVAVVLGVILLRSGGGDPYSSAVRSVGAPTPEVTVNPPTATTITVPVRVPGDIKVLPLNGTSVAGAGTAIFTRLKQAGYDVLAATNSSPAQASNVFFNPGFDREAVVVAQLLGLPDSAAQAMPTPPPVNDTRGADILVVVGPDLAHATNPSPAVTTSPTIRHTTATTARTVTPTTAHTVTPTTAKK
ncbi:MAG: LytR C-terminal domain-containing protein [Acidimicrobiia bacterium]|nr:LytR C-terminal domain-containing protein [Acidimicrobiia bacterium]